MNGGIFGSMFDWIRDGQMSAAERAAEWMFLDHLEKTVGETDNDCEEETDGEASDWF